MRIAANNVSSLTVTNNAPTSFPTGITTTVIFTAKDAAGNIGTATATVTVKKAIAIKDTIPPAVTPPNPLLMTFSFAVTSIPKANSKITAFLAAATATDKVGVVGGVTNNAPANFPVGTTTVTFRAKDAAGNIGTATATVTIKAIAPTAALVDGFDYPLGNRGVNANGIPLPFLEQITPEINSNYTNKTVTVNDYGRFAVNAKAAKWRNAQDVGSFNSAQGGVHPGEDWNLGAGDSDKGQPVYAVANGTVIAVRSTYRSGYLLGGWTMVLEHALSNGSKLYSFYAHVTDSKETLGVLTTSAAKFSLKVGDVVTRGQMIARLAAGSKTVGGMTNFPSHLHLEMRTIKPMLTVGGGLWEGDNGLGYYTHLTPTVPRRANAIRRPVSMTAAQINTAYARMQTSLGIIDPSDYIDSHRAGLVGKVTSISPQTVVSGTPTLFTITGTSLPSTLAASLQGSLKGSCGAVTVNAAGTSATITCTPGTLNTGASFYIKNVTGGLILPGSVAFTVAVNATAPVKDTTPPVITLIGAATVSVSQGQNYVDLGATAFDVVDGYVTASIVKTSTVNTSAIGTYTVTYNASDLSGNAAIPVVRTVNVVAATNPVVTTLNNGLVAYYPFDGYATDASGNGNNGTVFGGATYVKGAVGQGIKFNGVNSIGGTLNPDHVMVPNSNTLQFFTTMSVAYWVRIDGNMSQTSANCSGAAIASIHGTTVAKRGDRFGFTFDEYDLSSGFSINPWQGGKGLGALATSAFQQFRHIAYVINGQNVSVYVNGSLVKTGTGIIDFATANLQDLYLGVAQNLNGACYKFWYPLDGVLDDVRIYNRALTATEVLALAGGNLTNQAPAPTAPKVITTVGVAGTSQITANDPNFLDTHTYAVSTMPTNGTASVDRYGLATYTPNATYVGADSFVVTVTDNTGLSSVVSINVTIASFPTIGLFAHYPFDGSANDVSGNVRNGTVFGGVTYPTGVSGQAASFHNVNNPSFYTVNDYIQLPNITLNNSFAFTYSVLFRSDAHIHNSSIYSIGDNSNGLFFAHFVNQLGQSSFNFINNGVGIAGAAIQLDLSDKAWHQIIVNVNNNLIEVYDKGVFVGSAILNQNMIFQNAPNYLALNQWYNGTAMSSRFNGMVDDLRIYDRALTVTELSALTAGNSVNQAPIPTAPAITSTGGVASTSQIAANDPNMADTHTYVVSTAAINGTALVDAVGLVTYTPNAGYVGADSFVVTVTDGRGLAGLVTINATMN